MKWRTRRSEIRGWRFRSGPGRRGGEHRAGGGSRTSPVTVGREGRNRGVGEEWWDGHGIDGGIDPSYLIFSRVLDVCANDPLKNLRDGPREFCVWRTPDWPLAPAVGAALERIGERQRLRSARARWVAGVHRTLDRAAGRRE